jgi:hypothetical protein
MLDMKGKASWKIIALCLVSAAGNALLNWFTGAARLPLFLDTVFTAAMTLYAGVWAGLATGLLCYPPLFALCGIYLAGLSPDAAWAGAVFLPCVIVELLLVRSFRPLLFRSSMKNPAAFGERRSLDLFFSAAVPLLLLVILDCAAVSAAGGIIDTLLFNIPGGPRQDEQSHSAYTLKLGLVRGNMPFLAAAVLSRIPINIVDRFVVIFGGCGIALLYRRFLGAPRPSGGGVTPLLPSRP